MSTAREAAALPATNPIVGPCPFHLRTSGEPVFEYEGRPVNAYVCLERSAAYQRFYVTLELETDDGSFVEYSSDDLTCWLNDDEPTADQVLSEREQWQFHFESYLSHGTMDAEVLLPLQACFAKHIAHQRTLNASA